MKFVEPIREKEKVREVTEILEAKNERDMVMFVVGVYTGLRISDILKLRKKMVLGTHISLKEQKTKKAKKVFIQPHLRRILKAYTEDMNDNDFLFVSRQGKNRPITRVRAYEILRTAAKEAGLSNIGTHTLRKTFGYHMYQDHKDPAMLQDIFNHSSEYITLKYIGVNQDAIDKAMNTLRY